MQFYPETSPVPPGFRTDDLVLRPLTLADAEKEFSAMLDSINNLLRWSGGMLIHDDYTLEDEREDVEIQVQDHENRDSFTYTLLTPDESYCLGAVYLNPLSSLLQFSDAPDALINTMAATDATVRFWVREPSIEQGLDEHLLGLLRDWLAQEWPFTRVLFSTNDQDTRQVSLFEALGLQQQFAVRIPNLQGRMLFYE